MAVTAPWIQRQLQILLAQRGHAWLLQGPSGLGQFELALGLVRAWLCERASLPPEGAHTALGRPGGGVVPTPQGACGQCASCHGIDVHTHPDLAVLMPETEMLARGWPLPEKAQADIDDKKRKPSKEIRVDAMRETVEFAQRTSGRGRGKAVLVYPAERMNAITANALLKTLEEPAGDVRFVLATDAAHLLLPTIRSRCLAHTLAWPDDAEALPWLAAQGVASEQGARLLRAAGGRPAEALALAQEDDGARRWALLPRALARGDATALADVPLPEAVARLQKLCHDLMALQSGAAPRFFEVADLPAQPLPAAALGRWWQQLARSARTAEHPLNAGLATEFLVSRARQALNSRG
ncbi:DNA polymerase III subunit delta' [Ottowia testudinis]|uniref:DNA polymerase III subunit delta n=1 Tax=Ottowia testudinis TaxID=2816950 RepID=A0A975CP82_9BURK|nr:DNA polymerase III subunit delta' [Ottowia testudinis]QTD47158.1 DNA polymerase III subunit delta' [Ottowia testudinis]